jgi:hypothetical protein
MAWTLTGDAEQPAHSTFPAGPASGLPVNRSSMLQVLKVAFSGFPTATRLSQA